MGRLSIRGLEVRRNGVRLLAGLDLELAGGACVALVGANGCGKSALVQALAGLLDARGEVRVDGERLALSDPRRALRMGIALCPADRGVFGRLTVEENVAVGGYTLPAGTCRERMEEQFLRFPDIARRRRAPAGQLSGGERQQLAIARALMVRPKVLLLDEPSRGLSPAATAILLDTIRRVADEGAAVLIVDQALDWLHRHIDRLLIMADGRFTADVDMKTQQVPEIASAYFDLRPQ
jgi:branched-chain amino acid transport system ATP-binding protein